MAQNTDATTAEQFQNLDEQTQGDLKHEAWSRTIDRWMDEHPDRYEQMDSSSYISWDDMDLEVYEDENGRKYFHIVTGVQYSPGHENGKQRYELAHEFMTDYRDELRTQVSEHNE